MKAWSDQSLRFRLTLLYVGLLGVVLLIIGSGFYFEMRRFLLESTAARLRAQAKHVIERDNPPVLSGAAPSIPDGLHLRTIAAQLARDLTSKDTAALLLDRDGHILANGRLLAEEPLPPLPNPAMFTQSLRGQNEVNYIDTAQGQAMLVLLIPLRRAPASPEIMGVAQLSTPLEPLTQIALRQRLLLWVGGGFAIFLAALGTLWLTGSALNPLRRMIDTCRRIAAGDLSQRVKLPSHQDEVGQLADAFDEMVERLERTFAAQRRFVADAAHELRTPLTAISGSLEVLLRGSQDDPAAAARLLRAMYHEVSRLSRLSEQLLDLTRLNADAPIRRQTLDLPAFFSEFTPQARLLARERRLIQHPGPPLSLSADPDALKQLLFNLVDNAVQHTAEGGTIEINWRRGTRVAEIEVTDDGEGLAAEDLPHAFEPFYRGDRSRSRRRGGTGLGLTIVASLVKAHGGEIAVSSQPGRGARFTIKLPLNSIRA